MATTQQVPCRTSSHVWLVILGMAITAGAVALYIFVSSSAGAKEPGDITHMQVEQPNGHICYYAEWIDENVEQPGC